MVRHLEEVHPRQSSRQQHRVDFLLDVARQEEPLASIGPEQDNRDVVDRGAPVRRSARNVPGVRPQHRERDLVQAERVARGQPTGVHSAKREVLRPCAVARPRSQHARFDHSANPVPIEQCRKAGDVVLVRMTEHDEVDPAVPRRKLAIEGDQEAVGIGSAVNEHAATAVALEQDRVALADIHNRDVDVAVGQPDDNDAEHNDGR